jgi:hypothetical protein
MVTATRVGVIRFDDGGGRPTRTCGRCGIRREVNLSRPVPELCRDCIDVEAYVDAESSSEKCGTTAGYFHHRRHKTPMCGACRRAIADYRRENRKAIA